MGYQTNDALTGVTTIYSQNRFIQCVATDFHSNEIFSFINASRHHGNENFAIVVIDQLQLGICNSYVTESCTRPGV